MGDPAVTFRTAVLDDAAAVRKLTRAAYAKWVPLIGREPLPMTADYDAAIRDHRIDLLMRDHDIAGLVEMILREDHLLIENVAVAPAHQGQGLGRLLLHRAEDVARTLGHPEVRLYTNKLFAENVALYLRRGFAIDREEAWTGGVIVHMTKRLA